MLTTRLCDLNRRRSFSLQPSWNPARVVIKRIKGTWIQSQRAARVQPGAEEQQAYSCPSHCLFKIQAVTHLEMVKRG